MAIIYYYTNEGVSIWVPKVRACVRACAGDESFLTENVYVQKNENLVCSKKPWAGVQMVRKLWLTLS